MTKLILNVVAGPLKGESFDFETHDTFIFGRETDCHARLSSTDTTASRHHFLLEVNPPDARICDLGSLNGTHVNGVKYGGRPKNMTPEEARRMTTEPVDIKDGDEIKVGSTVFKVRIESSAFCVGCHKEFAFDVKEQFYLGDGLYACSECRQKVLNKGDITVPDFAIKCDRCGKNVSGEIPTGFRGNYVCEACRDQAQKDPNAVLEIIRKQAKPDFEGNTKDQYGDISQYEILKELGEGGMGAVYFARRKSDGKNVALKTLLAQVAVKPTARAQFQREIDVTKQLRHPNIVEFYDHGSSGTGFFFTLEFCAGGSVADLMSQRGSVLSLSEALTIIMQSLEGLAFAHLHEKVFVHRDLKPQNILLTATNGGIAKIADFGLAKSFQTAGLSGMTATGAFAGTFPFMPREQLTNFKRIKPVSDVWSIAATLFFMLTGDIPYKFEQGKSPTEVIMQGNITPIRHLDPRIPTRIADVIDRALAKDAKDRYQDAAELKKAFELVI